MRIPIRVSGGASTLPAALLIVSVALGAADLHVSGSGDDAGGNGTNGSPWRTIGRALEAAGEGDAIRIHAGLYDTAAGEVFPLDLRPGVAVVGDDPGACEVRGEPDEAVFRFPADVPFPPSTRIEGLTIKGGEVGVWVAFDGGLLVEDSEPAITRNVIRGNVLEGVICMANQGGGSHVIRSPENPGQFSAIVSDSDRHVVQPLGQSGD